MNCFELQHPAFPDVVRSVSNHLVDEWVASGWLVNPPPENLPRPATAKKTKASTK